MSIISTVSDTSRDSLPYSPIIFPQFREFDSLSSLHFNQGRVTAEFRKQLDPATTKHLLRKISQALRSFFISSPFETSTTDTIEQYVSNRNKLEKIIAGIVKHYKGKNFSDEDIRFKYFLLSDQNNSASTLIPVIDVRANRQDFFLINKAIKNVSGELGFYFHVNRVERWTESIKEVFYSKYKSRQLTCPTGIFLDDQTMLPLITIDHPDTDKAEDGIFVRKISADKFYVSVHVPIKYGGGESNVFKPSQPIPTIAISFFYNIKKHSIEDVNLALVTAQSYAKINYQDIDQNIANLAGLYKLSTSSRKDDLVRNISDAHNLVKIWLNHNKVGLNNVSGNVGSLLVIEIIKMSQEALAKYMALNGIPVVIHRSSTNSRQELFSTVGSSIELQTGQYTIGARCKFKRGQEAQFNQLQIMHALFPDRFPQASLSQILVGRILTKVPQAA